MLLQPNNKHVCFKLDFLQADSSALPDDLLGRNSVADLIHTTKEQILKVEKLAEKKLGK